jgi:predicted dehydrogenase
MLRVGLIGGGRPTHVGHAPALQGLAERLRVVALADRAPEARERTGLQLGLAEAHRYADYREMLRQESPELVVVAVPHAFHHEVTLAALHAGAHVITERPLALSLRDAQELLEVAESQGKLISVLHYYAFYPPLQEALRLVRAGAIGHPYFLRCEGVTGGFGAGTETYHPDWHREPDIAGGGVWMTSGYHASYLSTGLLGAPVRAVSAHMATFVPDTPPVMEDTALIHLAHEGGSLATLQVAWSAPAGGRRVLEVHGTEGAIVLDHGDHPLGVFSLATRSWHHPAFDIGHAASFRGIYQAIAECLLYGAPPPVTHRDALHTLAIIHAGYQSARSGCTEPVSIAG